MREKYCRGPKCAPLAAGDEKNRAVSVDEGAIRALRRERTFRNKKTGHQNDSGQDECRKTQKMLVLHMYLIIYLFISCIIAQKGALRNRACANSAIIYCATSI